MAWKPTIQLFKKYLNNVRSRLGCCDLCGSDVNTSSLLQYELPQAIICQQCVNDLPYFEQALVGGNLLSWPAVHKSLPGIHFEQLFSLSPYIYPFNHWLAQLKYLGRFELAHVFSALLCAQWKEMANNNDIAPVDLVVPVPLHINKWQSRGYNQAHLIGQPLAKQLKLPYDASLVMRIKNDGSQMGKTGAQRRKSLTNAFALHHKIDKSVKHVMLVDDVVTTGTTASEISKVLKRSGVTTVTLVTVCLTIPDII